MIIHCRRVLTKSGWLDNQSVTIQDGYFTSVSPFDNTVDVNSAVSALVPGFIDIQVNGGGGILFNQDTSASAIQRMFEAHRAFGTTAMLPTLITDSVETMAAAARAVIEARKYNSAGIVGVHFEGPWLSQAKKGVHPSQHIRAANEAEIGILTQPELGVVMVTVAPENVAPELISTLVERGVIVFLGHSNATAEQTQAALDAGARGFTHIFNAMSPLQSRSPGVVGAALNSNAYAGLIVDGFHVDAVCSEIALKCLGKERLCLVTDAMSLAASDETQVPFFDTIITKQNNKLTTPDGTLAGSCLTMIQAVQNMMNHCGVSLQDAVEMASSTPANACGLGETRGSIDVGYVADAVVLDNKNNIKNIIQRGITYPII